MARKTKTVTITAEGRDKGKKFVITEMSAVRAEKWAARAFLALANAGTEIPAGLEGAGMAAIAVMGLKALGNLKFGDAEPLLDEMMTCVQYMPDPTKPAYTRDLIGEDDIEEVWTLAALRSEVFELHTGFSIAGALSASQEPPAEEPKTENSQSISTFRRRSAQ